MTHLRTGHVKSMSAFDKLPPAVRQALRDAVHSVTTKAMITLTKALKAGAVTEAEIVEQIRKQDAERIRQDQSRGRLP